ncbi:LysR family transcriptional regulator [Brevibacillus nitrificans]|uniref:LysR family transcriptional regulator n=1 Tax=Brevibacillus nitrificans TaxID=651560 RepID=A0A3M8DH90_9BACL|nr:LysR family transcriptional regulator [Brevibacillus nitrificans]RNB86725.1 LysR family transcriptional regulator [Brevibacillus nitrificans]
MELVYLHTFREIARWGSFTRAAEELGYAQPTVTAQMQKLEHSYGAPLFERFGRKLRLTQAGEVLLPYAQELIRLYGESKEVVSRQLSGPVRIGTIDTLAAFFLPPHLQRFRQAIPAVDLVLQTGSEAAILQQIKEGLVDIGFIYDRLCSDDELVVKVIRQEELVMIMPPDHLLATRSSLTVQDLRDASLIVTEEGCTYRGMLLSLLQDVGVSYRIACQFSNPEAIKQCVQCGLGVALLPRMAVEKEIREGGVVAVPFQTGRQPFFIQLVYHKKKWLSQAMEQWINSIASEGGEIR